MRIILLFSFITFGFALIAQPLNYRWHRSDDATGGGNVTDVAGVFDGIISYTVHGALDVDPSYIDYIVPSGTSMIKYNNQKQLEWVLTFPNLSGRGYLLVDSVHNAIYAYGSFSGTFDSDPGPNTNNVTANQSGSYLTKVDLNGNYQWTHVWVGQPNDVTGVDIDENGTIYLAGKFRGTFDFDPTSGQDLHTAPGTNYSLFLIKINKEGNYITGFQLGPQVGQTNVQVINTNSLKIKDGNVFFGVQVYGQFDANAGIDDTLVGATGSQSLYLVKYDTLLVYQDICRIKYTYENGFRFTTGYQDYIAVTATGAFTVNNSGSDTTVSARMVVLLLDENFNFQWMAGVSPTTNFSTQLMSVSNIDFSDNGHIFITGGLRETHNLDISGGTFNLVNGGSTQEPFIVQYDVNQNLISANLFEHIGNVNNNSREGLGLYKDKVLLGLGVLGKFDIDFGPDVLEISHTGSKPLLVEYVTCIPERITIYDTICDGTPYWFGNQNIHTSGKYNYSFVNQNGCDSIVTLHLNIKQLNVGMNLSNYGTISCINPTYSSYQWIRCADNLPVTGANLYQFTPANDDFYKVIISDGIGCSDTSNCYRITDHSVNGSPVLEWASTMHKVFWGEESAVTTDSDGNFYVIGTMWNKVNVELFGGTTEVYQSPNSDDLIIAKYTKDGDLLWAFPAGIQGNLATEQGASVAVDVEGNVYAAGIFVSTFDIDPDEYTVVEQKASDPSCCNFEIFLIKINPNGQLIWNKTIGGVSSNAYVYDIAVNSQSDVVICGANTAGPIDFDPGIGVHTLPGKGFAALYSKDGNFINVIEIMGSSNSFVGVRAGKFDKNDNLIISGSYGSNTDFDIGPGVTILTASTATQYSNASFIASYNSSLNLNWAKKLHEDTQSTRKITSLVTDKNGNAFLAGSSISGSYIRKYNPTGSFQTFPLTVPVDANISLGIDRYNNLLVSGRTFFSVNLGGGVTIPMNTTPGAFLVKYSNTGTRKWHFTINDNVQNQLRKGNLATDEAGNFYYLGNYAESRPAFDIDPSDSVVMIQPQSAYIAKFGEGCDVINTNYTIANNEVSVQNGGFYQLKKCNTSEIISEGFNNTFSVCETDSYYIVIKRGDCIDSTDCFSLTAMENPSDFTASLNATEVTTCDPVVLEINASQSLCNQTYDWSVNGNDIQFNSPSYTHTLLSNRDSIVGMIILGADTVFTDYAIITIGHTISNIDTIVCSTYVSPSGMNYTNTGVYFDTILSSIGCDSIFNINLTIEHPTELFIDTMVCDTYTSPWGQVYQTTGIYTETVSSGVCDSTYTIDLTIEHPTELFIDTTVCDLYTSPWGQVYQTTGVYTETVSSGICDSTYTIDLTVEHSTELFIDTAVCDTYTSPWGQVYQTTGIYTETVSFGVCDSTYTINLIINESDLTLDLEQHTIISNQQNGTFQWINCETNTTISGATTNTYTVSNNGSFAVIIYNNNCIDTSECISIFDLGIQNVEQSGIVVFPNPTKEKLEIKNIPTSSTILIKDIGGSLIKTVCASDSYNLDVSYLANGVYLLEVHSENKKVIIKFIKQ